MKKDNKLSKRKEQKIKKIEEYYNKALAYILNYDYENANILLYNLMPVELYDRAITIALDKNSNSRLKNLKELIVKVDTLLAESFILDAESSEDNIIEEESFKEFD